MSEKTISIIIPYFNKPDMLVRLLDSIPRSEHYEVIVVNDHSTENLEEYERLKEAYSACGVLFLENREGYKYQGSARNTGLVRATGKWIMFADMDDYFLPGAFDTIEKYTDSDNDVVYFLWDAVIEGTDEISNRDPEIRGYMTAYLNNPTPRADYDLRYRLSLVFPRLIRHELLERYHIRFACSKRAEDAGFAMRVGHFAQKYAVDPTVVLRMSERPDSVSYRVPPEERILHDKVYDIYYIDLIKIVGRKKMKSVGRYKVKTEIIIRLRMIKTWFWELKNGKIAYKDTEV